jgi:hypothetical protein
MLRQHLLETSGSCRGAVMGGAVGCAGAVSTSGYSPGAPWDSCIPSTSFPTLWQCLHTAAETQVTCMASHNRKTRKAPGAGRAASQTAGNAGSQSRHRQLLHALPRRLPLPVGRKVTTGTDATAWVNGVQGIWTRGLGACKRRGPPAAGGREPRPPPGWGAVRGAAAAAVPPAAAAAAPAAVASSPCQGLGRGA